MPAWLRDIVPAVREPVITERSSAEPSDSDRGAEPLRIDVRWNATTTPPERWNAVTAPPAATYVTPVVSKAPGALHPAGGVAGLIGLLKIGAEAPGRYVYLSPDGERGAEIGRGGIGRVLLAMDEHLGREVAIKELRPDLDGEAGQADAETTSRFLAEARITGQLEHPNIVPVYELGRRLDGRLYYTMRMVRGETLSAALEHARTLPERLALLSHFAGLCNAIAYAHSRGVVHRDIKPDNVMIGEFGETIVLDWGIAKVKGEPETPGARAPRGVNFLGETSRGDIVGTPLFMSPEQARGEVDQIDEASDVWSLGVVLYVLLSGRPPFMGKSAEEVVRQVIAARPTPLRRIEPLAPLELCAIAERALAREKSARYASVRELAKDIAAFMSGARVRAYDYSALELFRRFYRKNRAAAIVALVAFVALLVVATELQRRILAARDRALAAEQIALEKERAARQSLAEVFTERALNASVEGDVVGAELYAARALTFGERADARGAVIEQTNRHELVPLRDEAAFVGCTSAAASTSGEVVCAKGHELWSWAPGAPPGVWELGRSPARLAISGDGRTLLAGFEDGRLAVYDRAAQKARHEFRSESGLPGAVALSEDGARFLTTAETGWAQLWETASVAPIQSVQLSEPITARALAPSGNSVALGGRLGALVLWDPESGARVALEGHRGTVTALAFSRKGDLLASAGSDRSVSLWSTATGKRIAPALRDIGNVPSLAFAPDGVTLAFGSDDRMLGIIDARSPQRAERVRGHTAAVSLVSFAADDALVSLSAPTGLRVWSYRAPALPRELPHKANVLAQAFASADVLATAGLAREGVCLWQLGEERCKTRLPVRDGQIRALAVHAASRRLALGTSSGVLTLWNIETGLPERVLAESGAQLRALEFAESGAELLSSASDGSVRLWELATGSAKRSFTASAPAHDAVFDAARSRIIVGTRAGSFELFGNDGARQAAVAAHGDWVMDIALHAASNRLASAGGDGTVALWRLDTLEKLRSIAAHEGRVLSVDLSPDGALLASAGEDGSVWLWNTSTGAALARLVHHRGAARSVRFAPNGAFVASGGDDGSVRLWDLSRAYTRGDELLERAERRSGVTLDGVTLESGHRGSPAPAAQGAGGSSG